MSSAQWRGKRRNLFRPHVNSPRRFFARDLVGDVIVSFSRLNHVVNFARPRLCTNQRCLKAPVGNSRGVFIPTFRSRNSHGKVQGCRQASVRQVEYSQARRRVLALQGSGQAIRARQVNHQAYQYEGSWAVDLVEHRVFPIGHHVSHGRKENIPLRSHGLVRNVVVAIGRPIFHVGTRWDAFFHLVMIFGWFIRYVFGVVTHRVHRGARTTNVSTRGKSVLLVRPNNDARRYPISSRARHRVRVGLITYRSTQCQQFVIRYVHGRRVGIAIRRGLDLREDRFFGRALGRGLLIHLVLATGCSGLLRPQFMFFWLSVVGYRLFVYSCGKPVLPSTTTANHPPFLFP